MNLNFFYDRRWGRIVPRGLSRLLEIPHTETYTFPYNIIYGVVYDSCALSHTGTRSIDIRKWTWGYTCM